MLYCDKEKKVEIVLHANCASHKGVYTFRHSFVAGPTHLSNEELHKYAHGVLL